MTIEQLIQLAGMVLGAVAGSGVVTLYANRRKTQADTAAVVTNTALLALQNAVTTQAAQIKELRQELMQRVQREEELTREVTELRDILNELMCAGVLPEDIKARLLKRLDQPPACA